MKSNLFTFLLLCFFGSISAQESYKTQILEQLSLLESKISTYKATLSDNEKLESDNLYAMNADFQQNLDIISDKIYEQDLSESIESVKEIIDIDDDVTEDYDDDNDPTNSSTYKGDMKIGDDIKSKVMNSMDDFAIVLGWGINSMTYEEGNEIDHKLWGSSNWEVGFVNKRQIGNTKSRFVYGLTLNTHYFKLDDTNISASNETPGYIVTADNTFDDVRFGVRYLQAPLGVGFKIGKKTEIFVGGHVGVKLRGYTNKEFDTEAGEEVNSFAKADYGLNKFNYGVDFSIGAKSMRLFGKYDLNPLFKEGTNHNIYTFGLRYGY